MPFDSTQTAPSLRMLSDILRDKSQWPEGFKWDYSICTTCAMGLAHQLWHESIPAPRTFGGAEEIGEAFGLSYAASVLIFLNLTNVLQLRWSAITPEHVADAIDAELLRLQQQQES